MKIFSAFVILSIIYGMNGYCLRRNLGGNCPERTFPEPEPKEVHYIYHGETCDCPKYHNVFVEKPVEELKPQQQQNFEYRVDVPAAKQDEVVQRYLFDVRVEKPAEKVPQNILGSHKYNVIIPEKTNAENTVRYIFDSRIETPAESCKEKPWQGLVAQVDKVLLPSKSTCQNSDHPDTCDCGCRNPSHTEATCTCNNRDFEFPIDSRYESFRKFPVFNLPFEPSYNNEDASRKVKRDVTSENNSKSKRKDFKLPKLKPLKKLSSKDLEISSTLKDSLKLKKLKARSLRQKRKPDSACGYTYESCDPKKHNKDGCPLCYRCKCEPISRRSENEKFSPYDIKVPYKLVKHAEAPGSAPTAQEFDYEYPVYTGLQDNDMYKKYIQQVVSKYPEHMSRTMPRIEDQERDLMHFIGELAKADKSPGSKIENEDIRYRMMDDAMEMYKYYEKAVNGLPKLPLKSNDEKQFRKRGTVLKVIELPENFDSRMFEASESSDMNVSASQ